MLGTVMWRFCYVPTAAKDKLSSPRGGKKTSGTTLARCECLTTIGVMAFPLSNYLARTGGGNAA